MRIYLDVCCLSRPFDDQGIDRNHLEAEAVLAILRRVGNGDWTMIRSEALELELAQNPDADKREATEAFLSLGSESVAGAPETARMTELTTIGFKAMDALHLACAETARCDVFLTTDDRLLRRAVSHRADVHVAVANPLAWLAAQIGMTPP